MTQNHLSHHHLFQFQQGYQNQSLRLNPQLTQGPLVLKALQLHHQNYQLNL